MLLVVASEVPLCWGGEGGEIVDEDGSVDRIEVSTSAIFAGSNYD